MLSHAERVRFENAYRQHQAAPVAHVLAALFSGVRLAEVMPRVVDLLLFWVHRTRYDLVQTELAARIADGVILNDASVAEIARAVGLRRSGGFVLTVAVDGQQRQLAAELALALVPPKRGTKYDLSVLGLAREYATGRDGRAQQDTLKWDVCRDLTDVYEPRGSLSLEQRTQAAFADAARRGGVADAAFFEALFPLAPAGRFDLQHLESLLDVWTDPSVPASVGLDGWPRKSAALLSARIQREHEYTLLYEAIRKLVQNEVRQSIGRGASSFNLDVWLDNEVDRRRKRKPAGDGITDELRFLISPFDASDPEWSPPVVYGVDPGVMVGVTLAPSTSEPKASLWEKFKSGAGDAFGSLGIKPPAPLRPLLDLGDLVGVKPHANPKGPDNAAPPVTPAPPASPESTSQTITAEALLVLLLANFGAEVAVYVAQLGYTSAVICYLSSMDPSALAGFDVQAFASFVAPLAGLLGVSDLCALGASILTGAVNLGWVA